MALEWFATCKDCGQKYGYSDASYQLSDRRGLSRPERCPSCRKLHTREISTLGLSHFELTPLRPIPESGLQPGRLGGLVRPPRIHQQQEQKPTFDYDKFGIKDQNISEYFQLMEKHQVTVVVAPTGAGKSTFLPYRLMVPPEPYPTDQWTRHGQIVITQPRIQATRNIPAFVAESLHGSTLGAGFDVGFRHSGSPATDWRNKMVYMTDGTLINMLVRNELGRLGVIMIDEAHERSLNIDLILGLLKAQLPRYPHLKLIIASATIDTQRFLEYYGAPAGANPDEHTFPADDGTVRYDNARIATLLANSPVGFYGFPGKRQYPIEARFREGEPIPENQFAGRMPDEVADKVFEILLAMETGNRPDLITMTVGSRTIMAEGDILAFLHGEKPIERAVSLIREKLEAEPALAGKVDVLPLYTKLPQRQQDLALKPKQDKRRWRVVVSTNVAETSLTVEGIVHVVESGLINESQWDPQTQTSFIVPKIHSQAGCKQRWGRAGRVQPGIAHCLYTKEQLGNFPAHTFPEIVRAPLDQIVLTAKAAGVDDIKAFDWIQRPAEAELERAPHYLRQIKALDEAGDLTEHGLELRNFAGETDVANLMILADRFGCAVEMATLLPMLSLGGYTRLLLWDRGWDAPTKRTVHRIHQGLIDPCLDDLEFYLKLWEAWEGSLFGRKEGEARRRWARQFFVNHDLFSKQIIAERETLLGSLSAHKKESTARPVNFDLLDRVRIVLTYGLANQIYQLANRPEPGQAVEGAPIYRPYIADAEANPELVKLHEEALVEISPESICYGRQLPDYFVCGKRQRVRRRLSPQAEPVTIITAAFLALIKPAWLSAIGKPPIAVARLIAHETRQPDGQLIQTTTKARLFIDQRYPIGATYVCRLSEDGQGVVLGQQEKRPPRLLTRSSFEEVEASDEIEVLEPEKELAAMAGVAEAGKKATVVPDEEEDTPTWIDMVGDEEPYPVPARPVIAQEEFAGRLVYAAAEIPAGSTFSGVVTGFDFDNRHQPAVRLEQPVQPDPFNQFQALYRPGDDVTAAMVSVEQYVNDRLLYLVVREVKSGLEIVLDPYDASLIGRNFAIDYLRQLAPGTLLTVTVEESDDEARRVRATQLKVAETAILRFIGKQSERNVEAVIVEAQDNGLFLWLEPAQTADNMPTGAFAYIGRLPQRPDEMSLGQGCRVIARPHRWQKPLRRALPSLPEEVEDKLARGRLGNNLEWDRASHTLSAKGRISYEQRRQLLALSDEPAFRRAVNILFRRSNELDVEVVDVTGIRNLQSYQFEEKRPQATVVSVDERSVTVEIEGLRTRVPKHEAVYDLAEELPEKFKPGDMYDVAVKEADEEKAKVLVSLLRPEDDPINQYQPSQMVHGTVTNVVDFGAFVELSPGAQGLVHIGELAWQRVQRPAEIVNRGQSVKVQILSINREERRLELTMRLPENDPLRRFQVSQRVQGKVSGFTSDGVGAFVELAPGVEGFLYKDQIGLDKANDARELLQEGQLIIVRIVDINYGERKLRLTSRGLYEETLWVPASHRSLVIGQGGGTIKEIQQATQTRINLDDDGYCLIEGMSQQEVQAARQRLQAILATRIVTFPIQERQIPMLIGKGGGTIKDIQASTRAKIDVDSNGRTVVITAENDYILGRVLEQIQKAISYYVVTIQVSPSMVGRVIGPGGATIKSIRDQTGVRIDIPKDGSGRVTVEGKSSQQVQQALSYIQAQAGYVTQLSTEQGTLSQYTDLRQAPPSRQKPQPQVPTAPVLTRQAPPQAIPLPQRSQPAKPTVRPVAPPPQYYQESYRVTQAQIALLTRKQGGILAGFFGGKSAIEKAQEATGTRITVDASAGILRIVGRSQQAVQAAIAALRQVTG